MRRWARRHPWRFAAASAAGLFALGSVLPIWTAWWFSEWEGLGEPATFWAMLTTVPRAAGQIGPRQFFAEWYWPELAKLVALLTAGAVAGRLAAGRLRGDPSQLPPTR